MMAARPVKSIPHLTPGRPHPVNHRTPCRSPSGNWRRMEYSAGGRSYRVAGLPGGGVAGRGGPMYTLTETEWIWRDGEFIRWADAKVHVLSHSMQFGSSAFEGIRSYKTPRGPAIFRLQDHLRR